MTLTRIIAATHPNHVDADLLGTMRRDAGCSLERFDICRNYARASVGHAMVPDRKRPSRGGNIRVAPPSPSLVGCAGSDRLGCGLLRWNQEPAATSIGLDRYRGFASDVCERRHLVRRAHSY